MAKANVYNMAGQQVGEIELSEAVFGIEPNQAVVHEVVKNHPVSYTHLDVYKRQPLDIPGLSWYIEPRGTRHIVRQGPEKGRRT